jgi:DNA-binding MarR family transcriptional regulator
MTSASARARLDEARPRLRGHLAILGAIAKDTEAGQLHIRHLQMVAMLAGATGFRANVGRVAFTIGLPSSTVTRAADRLVELGLAVRVHSETDRRNVEIVLTETGLGLDRRVAAALAGVPAVSAEAP